MHRSPVRSPSPGHVVASLCVIVAMLALAAPASAGTTLPDPRDTRGRFDISSVRAARETQGGTWDHSHIYMFSAWTFDPISDDAATRGSIRVFIDIRGSSAPDLLIRTLGPWTHHSAKTVLFHLGSNTKRRLPDAWLWRGAFHVTVGTALLDTGDHAPRYFIVMSNGTSLGTDRAPNTGWKQI